MSLKGGLVNQFEFQAMQKKDRIKFRILVTGSNGFVGSRLCAELLRRGNDVLGTRRKGNDGERRPDILQKGQKGRTSPDVKTVNVGDIGPETNWAPALVGIDAVVHLAARVHLMKDKAGNPSAEFRKVNVAATRRLAEDAVMAGVKRIVFLSSIKVNGDMTQNGGAPFTEKDKPCPGDAYSVSKWEAEQVLREIESRTGIEIVIIRPPLLYGPGVKANFLKLIQLVENGIPLPFGGIRNQRSLLGLMNMVDLICCCLDHPAAAGETFLACDGEDISTPELVRRIASAIGKPARLLAIPEGIIRLGGKVTGKSKEVNRLCGSLQIDATKLRRLLGWKAPCKMTEELAQVAAWRGEKRSVIR